MQNMGKMGSFSVFIFSFILYNVHLIFSRYFIMSLFILLSCTHVLMYAFQNIHFILGSLGCFTCKRTSEDDTESLLKHCNGYSKYYYLTSFCCCYCCCCRCCSFWFRDTMCKFVLLWLYVVQHFINQLYSHSFTTVRYDIYGKALYFSPITSIIWHAFSVIMAHIIYYLFGTYANTKADFFPFPLSVSHTLFSAILSHFASICILNNNVFSQICSLGMNAPHF